MASDQTPMVEFSIEVGQIFDFETEDEEIWKEWRQLEATVTAANGLKRTTRCWDFPSWRLHRAAANKEEFEEGADVNVNAKDLDGRTALHEAAKAGNLAAAAYLVSRGAHIDAQDNQGTTPLVEAVRFNHGELARFLLAEHRRVEEEAAKRHIGSAVFQGTSTKSSSWNGFMDRILSNMMTERKNDVIKWLVLMVNVGLELCQVLVSEEEGDGRISGKLYRDLTAGCSWICLVLSIAEFVYEVKKNGAKWTKRRGRYCFYSPGIHSQVFGSFMLWFGLISSTVQFCLNTVALVVERVVVKFDYLSLLLAICLLLAAFLHGDHHERKMVGAVKCVAHGECGAEGVFRHGIWVFQCPQCHIDKIA